jgi:hypothetical protein
MANSKVCIFCVKKFSDFLLDGFLSSFLSKRHYSFMAPIFHWMIDEILF